ncbi:MAG: division/cell wall cluster transcriptional repressor MraZ [bacterium]|nr:division/cell wall cluster transcriptional repressor MraZ [bacterium]
MTDEEQIESTNEFQGCYHHNLDGKGRVSMPSAFRAALGRQGVDTVVITNFICDGARCLEGYSMPDWRKFEQRLRERSRFDPTVRKLENYYLARSVQCVIDSSGRILLPQNLRDYAGMEKEVVFTSSLHGFRIWDRRIWDVIFQEAEAALLDDPALFAEVDISR